MKFSESWLRTFVNPTQDGEAIAHALTMAGLEVEELQTAAPPFSGVVAGRIVSFAKHPSADRLSVCQVDVGDAQALNIVCGAPNVAAGMLVPCARVGARLPPLPGTDAQPLEIRRASMRGVASEGMLCSARELGLSDDHSGLLALPAHATPGADVRALLDLDDRIFTVKLTPNRADALSVLGIAREVAALTGAPLVEPAMPAVPATVGDALRVTVHASDLCGRFSGRLVRGVNARAATPQWMKDRLERAGQRPISALVDISNYVMLELGRPSHIFDADKIAGGELHVRWGRAGESVALLNGQTVAVDASVGVIADARGPEALAGIMGGDATAVSLETTSIFIEAAFWWPAAIQGRARRYNFATEAGHRFERGVDFSTTVAHVERITALVLEICGGAPGPIGDQILSLPERPPVRMRVARCRKVIGVALAKDEMLSALGRLGLPLRDLGEVIEVTPPPFRFDLSIEEDLIEEVARMHGFDNIPALPPKARSAMFNAPESRRSLFTLRDILAGRDYQEVVNYSFVDAAWEADLAGNLTPIRLKNPIASQMGVMRSSLFGSLVANVAYNLNRKQSRVRVFEVGRVFRADAAVPDGPLTVAGVDQPMMIGAVAFGAARQEQWGSRARPVDFFDVKGDLEALLPGDLAVRFVAATHPALHPGRSAQIFAADRPVGWIGELHPRWVAAHDLPGAPVLFEIDTAVLVVTAVPSYAEVAHTPPVLRDIALVVDAATPAGAVLATLTAAADSRVTSISLFDHYRPAKAGGDLAESEKSLAFRVVMQDTQRTLTDAEAEAMTQKLVDAAVQAHRARLRA
ncbi:MAG: phenylalanine--tRNA ligase subunit beta [Burkholderiales bacterium]|nr:phenylalanine--tRNA ligase subunit beta [Burkholderiales bacterium]